MGYLERLITTKNYLLLTNVVLVFFLILFSNLKLIPLHAGDFIFAALLVLFFALYRPGWCFLFFIGMLPLENINLAPAEWHLFIRPYQFFGVLIIVAIIIRFLTKRLFFKLIKPAWYDWLVFIFVFAGFLSVIGAPEKIISLKLSVILGSFAALYFLARNYIQTIDDLQRVIPFFVSSSIIVVLYGIWQNWAYLHNLAHFEVMPGRPNATFTEPDWLGMFLVLLTSVIYIFIYYFHVIASEAKQPRDCRVVPRRLGTPRNDVSIFIFLIFTFILLILTVSRSAWLGALITAFMFLFAIWTKLRLRNWRWREVLNIKLKILASLIIAIVIVYVFHLTNFQLFNRVESVGTGLQKITISCQRSDCFPPETINNIENLETCGCRHINLEEIDQERSLGYSVLEVYRKDPNVQTRNEIYRKSIAEIKKHPVLGIGWGNINNILGRDERGTPLNSSNIFLETWLGSGIIGFLALVVLLGYILLKAIKNYHFHPHTNYQKNLNNVTLNNQYSQSIIGVGVNLFIIISWFGVLAANMFNAGVFLGIFWIWLAVVQIYPVE